MIRWSQFANVHLRVWMMFWGVIHGRIQSHGALCWQCILKLFRKKKRLYYTYRFGGKLRLFKSSKRKVKVAQSFPTLCDPMDYTVHGILQARILEWVGFPFSGGSSQPRNPTGVSCLAGRFFTNWAIREELQKVGNTLFWKRQIYE